MKYNILYLNLIAKKLGFTITNTPHNKVPKMLNLSKPGRPWIKKELQQNLNSIK